MTVLCVGGMVSPSSYACAARLSQVVQRWTRLCGSLGPPLRGVCRCRMVDAGRSPHDSHTPPERRVTTAKDADGVTTFPNVLQGD